MKPLAINPDSVNIISPLISPKKIELNPIRITYKSPETLNPVIKLYIDKHNTPITSNFKLNRQSSGTSVHS
jgi:hypothetical protein